MKTPDKRAKSIKEMRENFEASENTKPYHCHVPIYPGKEPALVRAATVDEFWKDVHIAHSHSCYRDFVGIRDAKTGQVFPVDSTHVPEGKYIFCSRTVDLPLEDLLDIINRAQEELSELRPLHGEQIGKLHDDLTLQFNHFSLKHEGSNLSVDEMEVLTEFLLNADPKDQDDKQSMVSAMCQQVDAIETDVLEAKNHISVSLQLSELAMNDVTETTVLQLHAWIMDGLLTDAEEGGAGEYRRVSINVSGSSRQRPKPSHVPELMAKFAEQQLNMRDSEHIVDFLARLHSNFQDIHPFRDGNGRTGRVLMNIFLLQHGYPILAFGSSVSNIFNHGVDMATRGNADIFKRLLAETMFDTLQAYESVLGKQLLPSPEQLQVIQPLTIVSP